MSRRDRVRERESQTEVQRESQTEEPGTEPARDLTKEPVPGKAPDRPTKLSRKTWVGVLKRTVKQFNDDNLSDWAAALTYYSILSIFPGLLVLISAVSLLGSSTKKAILDNITQLTPPGAVQDTLKSVMGQLEKGQHAAGILAVVGLAGALWSASGYVSAFMRAANAVYDVPEGRPFWKMLPLRVGITLAVGTLLAAASLSMVLTGRFAEQVGKLLGIGQTAVTVWGYAKWPALLLVLMIVLAILYYASPNARQTGFRWISPGSVLAVVLWLAASAGFALYVANFASYNRVYGALGAVITFLVWLWLSNIAVLLGAEFDAELERGRAIEGGLPEGEEPFLALRDDRKVKNHRDADLT
jgi:membrane protein